MVFLEKVRRGVLRLRRFKVIAPLTLLLLILAMLLFSLSVAQPVMEWSRTYGETANESAWSVVQTSDGGYLLTGHNGSFFNPQSDVILVKTDASGNGQLYQTYGGTGNDFAFSVVENSDGEYVIAGSFDGSVWLATVNSAGILQINSTSGGTGTAYSVLETSDGGYALAVYTSGDTRLVKLYYDGNLQWSTYVTGDSSFEVPYSLLQTDDGGYAIAGYNYTLFGGPYDAWLVKTDSAGNIDWSRTFGGTGNDYVYSMVGTSDGGYALVGGTNSSGAGGIDFWLTKVVVPPLTASTTPLSTTVTRGQQAAFRVNASGGVPPYTYQWYDGTGALSGETSTQLTVTTSATGSYQYYCNVTDVEGKTINSNTVTLTVNPPPSTNGDGDTTPPPEDGGDGGTTPPPQDTTPPTGSIRINNGASTTNTTTITLNLQATDSSGVAEMRFSNDNVTWSDWQTYSTSASWTLTEGDGTKTVYVQFKDNAGLISTYSGTITLATQPDLPDESAAFPIEYVIIIVAIVVVIAVVAFIIYKLLKRPKKPPAPAQLRITAEPANIVADGETKSVITLQLLDKKGNPITAIADTQVKISAAKGKLETPTVVVPKGKAAEQTIIVSSKESGVVPVSAEADGLKGVTITLNFLEKKRYCMHCGAIMPSKAKACQNCGKAPPAGVDTKVCHNCKSVIPIVAKFCSECGSSQKE